MKNVIVMLVLMSVWEMGCEGTGSINHKMSELSHQVNRKFAATYMSTGSIWGENFVLSGLRLTHTLTAMYSVGSEDLKFIMQLYLKFPDTQQGCEIMKMFTNFSGTGEGESNFTFKSILFYGVGMELTKSVENECFNNITQSLDFTESLNAENTINNWYNQIVDKSFLSRPPLNITNEMFMNGIHMDIKMRIPYAFSQDIEFLNYDGKLVKVRGMEKCGTFYYRNITESELYIIREDFVGSRFSSVILTSSQFEDPKKLLRFLMNINDVFSMLLVKALEINETCEMKVILPSLEIDTRRDLYSALRMVLPGFPTTTNVLERLTNNDSSIHEFLHSDFIKIIPTVSSQTAPGNKTILINSSFVFVIMDRLYKTPLQTVIYTGISKDNSD